MKDTDDAREVVVQDYETGREYANELSTEVKNIKEEVIMLRKVPVSANKIAPKTTPKLSELEDTEGDLNEIMEHLYEHYPEKERLMRQIIDAQQQIIDAKIDVYKIVYPSD